MELVANSTGSRVPEDMAGLGALWTGGARGGKGRMVELRGDGDGRWAVPETEGGPEQGSV